MQLLILGRGKTGSLIAEIAKERGHSVRVLGSDENSEAKALTAAFLADFDAVIDFTTPEAIAANLRACLTHGARVVVGTTGWYSLLPQMQTLASEHKAALLYGTNFSIGVQTLFRITRELARALPGYEFSISETHHIHKKDAPSGTAITLKQVIEREIPGRSVAITSHREGDASGLHVVEARSAVDRLELRHEADSRRGFAEGAVQAAEWIAGKSGVWDFQQVVGELH